MESNKDDMITSFLSAPRRNGYKRFLELTCDEQIHRAYLWNYAICGVVFPLIGSVEIKLRDGIHAAMTKKYAHVVDKPWYDQHFVADSKNKKQVENAKLYKKKGALKLMRKPDDVITLLTLGFWIDVLRTLEDKHRPSVIPLIFKDHPIRNPKKWGDNEKFNDILDTLRKINFIRNRIAHHEPLFKFSYNGQYPKNIHHGIRNIEDCVEKILETSGWIDKDFENVLRKSSWYLGFQELASSQHFDEFVIQGKSFALCVG